MRPAIAVVIPNWVTDLKKKQAPNTRALYQLLPALMQWKNYGFIQDFILAHAVNSGVKFQIELALKHIEEMFEKLSDTNSLVARISVSAYLPQQFILTIEPKEGLNISSNIVLRMNEGGLIEGVAREYVMDHKTNQR